jgi:hypothetical protein
MAVHAGLIVVKQTKAITALEASKTDPSSSSSHIPPPSNTQRLPTNIPHQRTDNRQNRPRSLRRSPRPAQRDVLVSPLPILPPSLLLLRNPQRNLHTVRSSDKSALLLGRRQASRNVPESDRVRPHAEGRAPFFGDGFGEAGYAGFGQGVVCLARVAVQARGRGDVYDVAGLAVFDAEVGGCGADELEGLGVVQGEDCVPLFVGCLGGGG